MAAAATSPSQAIGTGLELVPARSRSAIAPLMLRPGRHTLGSDPSCDLCLSVEGVAPQHCLIISGPQKTIIKALSPLTWINDGPVGESALRAGDRLIVGPVELVTRTRTFSETDEAATPSGLQDLGRKPSASPPEPSPPPFVAAPVPPPLPPLAGVANLLRSAEGSFPLPLPLQFPVSEAPSLSNPRVGRLPLRGESPFQTHRTEEHDSPAPASGPGGRSPDGSGAEERLAERERAVHLREQELAREKLRLDGEREAMTGRETHLADLEQERRILARQLEEMQLRHDREQDLVAELERERSATASLRAELDQIRQASRDEAPWEGRIAQTEELESLRHEVESLTKKLAEVRRPAPETDRSQLLQQRTELLAIRREAQEKLAEQQRMTAELDQARQALQEEAEAFRRQQVAAEEEIARVEQRMTDLESREAALLERERAVQNEASRAASLQGSLAERLASLEARDTALTALQSQLEEQRRQQAAAQIEAAELRQRDEALAVREAELSQVAAQLEGELQRIEQSADQQRIAEQELESRRRELEERDRLLQTSEAALARQRQDLESSEQRIRQTEADLATRLAEQQEIQNELEEADAVLSQRSREFEDEARRFEERLAELNERERLLGDREADLQERELVLQDREAALQFAPQAAPLIAGEVLAAGEMAPVNGMSPDEMKNHAAELDRLRQELDDRQQRLSERERALEEHMRAIVVADAERAHWTREHDRLANQIAEMSERVEEWRLQEAALAESRVFITSRERAIENRLIELERREARLSEREELVASAGDVAPPSLSIQPPASIVDLPLDRDLEAARLNAQSLSQRERELESKFESLGQRESALDDLAAALRRREAELDEREEAIGAPAASPEPQASSLISSVDPEELLRLEEDFRSRTAALDIERQEIAELRSELAQHREAFLEQFRNLEQERGEFYADQQALDQRLAGLEEERAALLLERQAFEEERLLSEVPLEGDSLPHWDGGPDNLAPSPTPSNPVAPRVTSERPAPQDRSAASIHDEIRQTDWPATRSSGRAPFSMIEPEGDVDRGDEPSAMVETSAVESARMAVLEMGPEAEAGPEHETETPEVRSSDALELRAHLADLFGIDLSRRRAQEPARAIPEDDYQQIDVEQPQSPELEAIEEPPVSHGPRSSDTHEDVDVATYMERLLARSRNSATSAAVPPPPPPPPPTVTVAAPAAPIVAPKSEVDSPEREDQTEEVSRPVRRPLQQEERDAIRGSMDSFRELANRTARAAVARHQLVKLRNTLSTKAMLAAFCGVVTVILVVPEIWGSDRYRFPALGCICITVIAALEWLRTKVRIKKLDEFVAESDGGRATASEEEAAATASDAG